MSLDSVWDGDAEVAAGAVRGDEQRVGGTFPQLTGHKPVLLAGVAQGGRPCLRGGLADVADDGHGVQGLFVVTDLQHLQVNLNAHVSKRVRRLPRARLMPDAFGAIHLDFLGHGGYFLPLGAHLVRGQGERFAGGGLERHSPLECAQRDGQGPARALQGNKDC